MRACVSGSYFFVFLHTGHSFPTYFTLCILHIFAAVFVIAITVMLNLYFIRRNKLKINT